MRSADSQTYSGYHARIPGGTLTKNNILIPEPLPAYCTEFPNLVERIANTTDVFRVQSTASTTSSSDGKPNQLLINEYSAGQGIAPHEDGAAYHPAVATISLGSAQCIDIYQYLSETDPSPPLTHTLREDVKLPSSNTNTADDAAKQHNGKAIAAVPLARVFLEPRSLFIMTGSLYQSHLHGISFSDTDILTPSFVSSVPIANLPLLGNPEISRTIEKEGSYRSERSSRVSLTFRKVEKVMKGGLGAGKGKGLFGLAKR
ncbi:hypothetical protein QFC24_006845 [Naganishia onofrii]|uniref:Uncharacterized protein n=1 Tax=Naganishia onofrii TaxID=1851511 RepID=A0ACC2WW92_9TREE|nr:hypothetical protein QFC24_006845 [Naganishia onofrii]